MQVSLEDRSFGDPSLEYILEEDSDRRRDSDHHPEEGEVVDHSHLDLEVGLAVDHRDRRDKTVVVPIRDSN